MEEVGPSQWLRLDAAKHPNDAYLVFLKRGAYDGLEERSQSFAYDITI